MFAQPCAEEQPALHPSIQELTEQIHRLLLQVSAHPQDNPYLVGSLRTALSPEVPSFRRLTLPCTLVPVLSSTVWAVWAKSLPGPESWAHLLLAQVGAAPPCTLGSVSDLQPFANG